MKQKANCLLLNRVLSGCAALGLALVLMSTTAFAPKQGGNATFTLKNAQAIPASEEFSMPVWSPDGTKLLVSSAHGMKLHLIDLKANSVQQLSDVVGSGFNASWSVDGKEIYYRHKSSEMQVHPEIKAIRLDNRQVKSSNLNPNGLLSASKAQADKDVVVSINIETLGIEAQTLDGKKSWEITHDGGQYYRPLVSPDQKQLIVHQGSEMLLYALDGSGFIKNLGTGIASSWSPDGQHVIAFLDESQDGHTISGAELYMIDVAAGTLQTLTRTAKVAELWPSWSADGKRIAYEDALTGQIYVADIVQQ